MKNFTDKKIKDLLESYDNNNREAFMLNLDKTEKNEAKEFFKTLDTIANIVGQLTPDKERLMLALGGKKSEFATAREILGSVSQMRIIISKYFNGAKILVPVAVVALIVVGYVGIERKPAPQVSQNDFVFNLPQLPEATGNIDDAVEAFTLAASGENAIFDTQEEDTTILASDDGAYSFDQNL